MATLIAQYLMNDGTSGQTPSTLTDNSGNGHDCTITWSSGVNWATNATGTCIRTPEAGNTTIITAPASLRTAVTGLTQVSIVCKFTQGPSQNTTPQESYHLFLYGDSEWTNSMSLHSYIYGADESTMAINSTNVGRYDWPRSGSWPWPVLGAVCVFEFNQTSGVTGVNRARASLDTVWQTNTVTDSGTGDNPVGTSSVLRIFGGANGLWPNGDLEYYEIWDGIFTDQERTDMYNALQLDTDSPWAGGGGPGPLVFTQQPTALTPDQTSVTGQATVDES